MFKKIFYNIFKNKKYIKNMSQIDLYEQKYKKIITEIDNAIKEKKEINFLHSGHCGDLIYSFAVIKKISLTHKCNFYVGLNKKVNNYYEKHPSGNIYINERMFNLLLPLLEKQKFLNKVKKHENEKIDINLDLFREIPISFTFTSPRWFFAITGEHFNLNNPSLFVDDHAEIKNKIVILRSFRFRNIYIKCWILFIKNQVIFIRF